LTNDASLATASLTAIIYPLIGEYTSAAILTLSITTVDSPYFTIFPLLGNST